MDQPVRLQLNVTQAYIAAQHLQHVFRGLEVLEVIALQMKNAMGSAYAMIINVCCIFLWPMEILHIPFGQWVLPLYVKLDLPNLLATLGYEVRLLLAVVRL